MPQAPDELEWFQRLLSKALPYAVAFFLFVLPVIRALREQRKQQAAARKRAEQRPLEESSTPEPGATPTWKELLEGSVQRETPPPVPAPPPVSRVPTLQPEVAPRDYDDEPSLEEVPPPPLVALESELPSRGRDFAPSEVEDESRAEELELARERAEAARQQQVAAAEYAAASPYRGEVAPAPASAVAPAQPAAPARRSARDELFGSGGGAEGRRAALRRAIVLREVLDGPLALREGGGR